MNKRMRVKSPVFSTATFDRNLGDYAKRDEMQTIRRQIERLGGLVEGLAAIKEKPDPSLPPAAIHIKYAKAYERTISEAKRSLDLTAGSLVDAQDKAYQRMLQKTKLDMTVSDAAEIRAHLKSMNDKERNQFISSAIDNGRFEVITSIANTSMPELAGLSPSHVETYKQQYIERVAPEFIEETKALQSAEQMLKLAFDSFKKSANEMREPNLETEALRQQQEANDAEAALNQQLNYQNAIQGE